MERSPVHADANEAALRYLAKTLHDTQLELAQAVGNLAFLKVVVADKDTLIEKLQEEVERTEDPID